MESGSNLIESAIRNHLSSAVIYVQVDPAKTIPAALGGHMREQVDNEGLIVRFETRDFLFSASDLFVGGELRLPVKGDKIRYEAAHGTGEYTVMPFDGDDCYRFSDPHGRIIRVQTKRTGTIS